MQERKEAKQCLSKRIKVTQVYGLIKDHETRCYHWNSELDVIGIKFYCCKKYYPCHSCHEECADHKSKPWPKAMSGEKAFLCGACGYELSIYEYLNCGNSCPNCSSTFNANCSKHYHYYFEV